jgi:hypothetical protein
MRWKASGAVVAREGVWVVMKSELEAHGGGRSGQQPNGKVSFPRVRRTLQTRRTPSRINHSGYQAYYPEGNNKANTSIPSTW